MAGDPAAPDDYDRACAVHGLAGAIPVDEHGAQALVLGDVPATSCCLPDQRPFLRWLAADSAGLSSAADVALADPATVWEECGTWVSDGPGGAHGLHRSWCRLGCRVSRRRDARPGIGPAARRTLIRQWMASLVVV
ncbi:Imm21 family immunity protein [Streptomyces vinaceus]